MKKLLIFLVLAVCCITTFAILGHVDEYAIKDVLTLSNGNVVIKQKQKDTSEELYGIRNAKDSVILAPCYDSIYVCPHSSSILVGQITGCYDLLNEDGSDFFKLDKVKNEKIIYYRYDDRRKAFLLEYACCDEEGFTLMGQYRIGNLKGEIIGEIKSDNVVQFAYGIDDAYIIGETVVDVNGASYVSDTYFFIGCRAINYSNSTFIDLRDGKQYKFVDMIEDNNGNTCIEYEDGIVNMSDNEIIVKYVDENNESQDSLDKNTNENTISVKKKYITTNQYGNTPYTLFKIIDKVPFYKANLGRCSIPMLYRPNDDGDMAISAYNINTIEGVIDYINVTEMHIKDCNGEESPVKIKGDRYGGQMTIHKDTYYMHHCTINSLHGQWAFFAIEGDDYRFRFSTENMERITYTTSVPANMLHHVPYMVSLAPFTEESVAGVYTIIKKRPYKPWLNKVWSDGTYVFRFDMSNVYIMKHGCYFGSVKYEANIDNISFVIHDPADNPEYPDSYYSLYVGVRDNGDAYLCAEDGDELLEVDFCDIGARVVSDSSLITPGTIKGIEGFQWLEGEWEYKEKDEQGVEQWCKLVVTDKTFKFVSSFHGNSIEELSTVEENPILIGHYDNYIVGGKILSLNKDALIFRIDDNNKQIDMITGEYSYVILKKK